MPTKAIKVAGITYENLRSYGKEFVKSNGQTTVLYSLITKGGEDIYLMVTDNGFIKIKK